MKHAVSALLALATCLAWSQEMRPTEGYLPRFSRTVARSAREQLPLTVQVPDGVSGRPIPVTFGVPFPRGALASADNARVLEEGLEHPCTVRRTATWERPDGDVKWLLVECAVVPGRRYALEYGTEVTRAPLARGVRVVDGGAEVSVDTGPLRISMRRDSGALLHGAWLDVDGDGRFAPEEVVIAPGAGGPLYVEDDRGTRYPLDPSSDYTLEIEQDGPLHAIIKTDGWYTSAEGTRLCRHTARLHAYAGQAHLRLEHTFVVAFDTEKVRLRDVGIPLSVQALGPEAACLFGVPGVSAQRAPARLVQEAADHFLLADAAGNTIAEGLRAPGWADCSGAGRGVTVGLYHMWQEFPRELEFTGEDIVAHPWAPHQERLLDFDAKAVLGRERYDAWNQVYFVNWYADGLDQYDQAYGLAKTTDLVLAFHGGAAPDPEPCALMEEPAIVSASPEWMCGSDVMGPLHPLDERRFAVDEHKMRLGQERFELLRSMMGDYGFLDYGDVGYKIALRADGQGWEPEPWRRWASRFYGHPVMPWVQLLRTGDRRYLQWGVDNARHVMDIDMAHLTDVSFRYPKHRGGRFGGNGGILHYAADIYDLGCDSHIDHLLLQFYLTGYRRAWDVLQEEAEFYLWLDSEKRGVLHAWGHRMTGGALRTMTALYQATWDERYLRLARRMADFCYANRDEQGVIRHDDVYMLPGMFTYYQATGDERMRELLLRCMRYAAKVGRLEGDPRWYSHYGLSVAYFLTGDESFLPWAERWRQEFVQRVRDTEDPLWRGQPRGEWDYCYLTLHLLYMPYYLAALAQAEGPIAPAIKDDAVTGGHIVLLRDTQEPFSVAAEWSCLDGRYTGGVATPELSRYVARHPQRARVVLRGPSDDVVASQDIHFPPDGRAGKVLLDAPPGPPGAYRLAVEGGGGLPYKLRPAAMGLSKYAYSMHAENGEFVAGADAYLFYVPPETERFELGFKTLALRRPVRFCVLDPDGETVREEEIGYAATPQADYVTWALEAPPQHRGRLWRFVVDPADPHVEQTYVRFMGVPPLLWTQPDAFFVPDERAIAAPEPEPGPVEPYSGAGVALELPEGETHVIPRGERAGDGGYANLDPRRGTLEFWFRHSIEPDDISDRTLVSCGNARLYRRSRIGLYLNLAGTRQSGFVPVAGQWYHVALTWDGGREGREPQTRLFINGIKTGGILSPAREPLGDWTAEGITIGGAPMSVDDLRVSAIVRYTEDFAPPEGLREDEHTLWAEGF